MGHELGRGLDTKGDRTVGREMLIQTGILSLEGPYFRLPVQENSQLSSSILHPSSVL